MYTMLKETERGLKGGGGARWGGGRSDVLARCVGYPVI